MQMESFKALSGKSQEKELCSLVEFFKMLGNPTCLHRHPAPVDGAGCLCRQSGRAPWHDAVCRIPSAKFIKVK